MLSFRVIPRSTESSSPAETPATPAEERSKKARALLQKASQLAAISAPQAPVPQPRPSNSFLRPGQIPNYLQPKTPAPEQTQSPATKANLKAQPRAPRQPHNSSNPAVSSRVADNFALFARELQPAGTPLQFESPLHLLEVIAPDWPRPHPWQIEELLRVAGYYAYPEPAKTEWTPEQPLKMALAAANGSGKDQFYIAATVVWFALIGVKNRAIITTASEKQLKAQTQPHIIDLIERCNRVFPGSFEYIHFHMVCRLTGSEIVLHVTNDAGRAEGFHPWPGGKMMMIFNEAKSLIDELWSAYRRCTGYSYWLEVSSPGPKIGHFFRSAESGVTHPAPMDLTRYYVRYISAYDCPHIPRSHIEESIRTETPEWVESSIHARFSNIGQSYIITEYALDQSKAPPTGADIGIGLDLAASKFGDENACYVRRGNTVIHCFFFKQADTTVTAALIDAQLLPWKSQPYIFRADDGGVGRGIIDALARMGWRIARCLNQSSPPPGTKEFLNLGAFMWFHVRSLFLKQLLAPVPHEPILRRQLTTRLYEQQDTTGKLKLESKDSARGRSKESPDRADAFVLCFFSYRTSRASDAAKAPDGTQSARKPARMSVEDYIEACWGNPNATFQQPQTLDV